jgi:hypothetical protein
MNNYYYICEIKDTILLVIEERNKIINKLSNESNLKQKEINYLINLKKVCDDELEDLYNDIYDLYEIDY